MKYYHADLNNGSSQSRGLALVTPTGVPIPVGHIRWENEMI